MLAFHRYQVDSVLSQPQLNSTSIQPNLVGFDTKIGLHHHHHHISSAAPPETLNLDPDIIVMDEFRDLFKICLGYTSDMSQICLSYAQFMPQICLINALYMSETKGVLNNLKE